MWRCAHRRTRLQRHRPCHRVISARQKISAKTENLAEINGIATPRYTVNLGGCRSRRFLVKYNARRHLGHGLPESTRAPSTAASQLATMSAAKTIMTKCWSPLARWQWRNAAWWSHLSCRVGQLKMCRARPSMAEVALHEGERATAMAALVGPPASAACSLSC